MGAFDDIPWGVMTILKLAEVERKLEGRANYSVLALISFVIAFAVARIFTTISSIGVEPTKEIHLHHYWYGLIMVGIGGWLGINYVDERIDRLAAIIYGAGGGLIGDEVGMLLLMDSKDYTTEITYPIIVGFLAFCLILLLSKRHSKLVLAEFEWFTRSRASVFFAVILASVSITFLTSDKPYVIATSAVATSISCVIIVVYAIRRRRVGGRKD